MSVQINSPGSAGDAPPLHDFVEIYRAHDRRIFRYCFAYLRNGADAEEATQETFARAARRLDQISGEIGPYLTAIARNVCYDVRRYYPHQHVAFEEVDGKRECDSPESQTIDRSLLARVMAVLTRNERRLLAFAYAGYTYEEIAGRTGMSAKAVSVAIARARSRLRRLAAAGTLGLLGPVAAWRWMQRSARTVVNGAASIVDTFATVGQSAALLALLTTTATVASIAQHGDASVRTVSADISMSPSLSGTRVALPFEQGGARTAPTQPSATAPAARNALLPAGAPTAPPGLVQPPTSQYEARMRSMTPSPSYAWDHTAFASGYRVSGCVGNCPALFRSADGGATWSDVNSTTFPGGTVVLPPAYPRDPTVYAMSNTGLMRSLDHGSSFQMVPALPLGPGAAAAAPALVGDDGGVLLAPATAAGSTWRYAGGIVSGGPVLPAGLVPDAIAYADASTLIAVEEPAQSATLHSQYIVVTCGSTGCAAVATLAGDGGMPALLVSPGFARDHAIAVMTSGSLYLSSTGGTAFTAVTGIAHPISSAAFRPGWTTSLLVASYSAGHTLLNVVGAAPGFMVSPLANDVPAGYSMTALLPADPRHILGALFPEDTASGVPGVRCSPDGMRWSWTC
jgi:RNA polymerase sigma factor (sigma-70 family)